MCKVCFRLFRTLKELETHCKEEHSGQGGITCPICGRHFSKRTGMRTHIRRTHEVSESVLTCDQCGKAFNNKYRLRHHKQIYHTGRTHECSVCKKTFACETTLKRHAVTHTNTDYKYTCDVCGKQFRDSNNLKVHILIHSKVKPFKCSEPNCDAGYTTKQCLQIHYRKVHGYSDANMPEITRDIPYTMEAYSQPAEERPKGCEMPAQRTNKRLNQRTKWRKKRRKSEDMTDSESDVGGYNSASEHTREERETSPMYNIPPATSHFISSVNETPNVGTGQYFAAQYREGLRSHGVDNPHRDFVPPVLGTSRDTRTEVDIIPRDLRTMPDIRVGVPPTNFSHNGRLPHHPPFHSSYTQQYMDVTAPQFMSYVPYSNSHVDDINASATGVHLMDL